jgi:hypothetical protein
MPAITGTATTAGPPTTGRTPETLEKTNFRSYVNSSRGEATAETVATAGTLGTKALNSS